ncbi:MAG TPA: hypothetical protein VFU50_17485 [Terriglobales bacterium]|nr:hypothetical protein [Terriglobales bacterium]
MAILLVDSKDRRKRLQMKLTELFLAQLEREAEGTRHALERVPEGRNDWRPHEKSMPLGYLAALVARMPAWVAMTINTDELVLGSNGGSKFTPKPLATRAELLQSLEESVAEAREALSSTNDEHLLKPWRFVAGGQVQSEDPRYIVLTDAVFSHLAHHRGQLTVYLRLNEASVPAIYGPSADERQIA